MSISTEKYLLTLVVIIFLYFNTGSHLISCYNSLPHVDALPHNGLYNGCFANICSETENYPYEKIRAAIEAHPEYHSHFGTVLSVLNRNERDVKRDHDATCQTERIKIYPRIGINTKKDRKTIVNTNDFQQEVSYATCLNTKCKQKYKLIELVVLDNQDNLSKSKFSLPVGCRMERNNFA